MKRLIVHEWIARHGGSENVLESMAQALPEAEILCLWNDAHERFTDHKVTESWLSRTPLRRHKAAALPLMPATWGRVDLRPYDQVLVSSHLFAHHVGRRASRLQTDLFVYVHTPARYIWVPELDGRGKGLASRFAALPLRYVDRRRAAEGAQFAANSKFISKRIEDTWGQPSLVIYPPVAIEQIQKVTDWTNLLDSKDEIRLQGLPESFVLGASRFVPYKNLERVIEVGESIDTPVVLAGGGPDRDRLAARAERSSVPVVFVDNPSNELLYSLYARALIYVFPPVEDFGIMPVEAMALGTPTLVNAVGGAAESVAILDGGATMTSADEKELRNAVDMALTKDMEAAKARATLFSEETFRSNIEDWLSKIPLRKDEHSLALQTLPRQSKP